MQSDMAWPQRNHDNSVGSRRANVSVWGGSSSTVWNLYRSIWAKWIQLQLQLGGEEWESGNIATFVPFQLYVLALLIPSYKYTIQINFIFFFKKREVFGFHNWKSTFVHFLVPVFKWWVSLPSSSLLCESEIIWRLYNITAKIIWAAGGLLST